MKREMEAKAEGAAPIERGNCSYDPDAPENVEDRKHDDTSEGIDWEEIIAATQEDFEAGRFSYNSAEYATEEEARAAFVAWLDGIAEKVKRETASLPPRDAKG